MSTKINDESKLEQKNFLNTTVSLCKPFFDKNEGLIEELDLWGIDTDIIRLYDKFLSFCEDVFRLDSPIKGISLNFEEILKRNDAFFECFGRSEDLSEILADNIAFQKEFEKYLPELSNEMYEKIYRCELRSLTYVQRKIIDNHEKIIRASLVKEPVFKLIALTADNSEKEKKNKVKIH